MPRKKKKTLAGKVFPTAAGLDRSVTGYCLVGLWVLSAIKGYQCMGFVKHSQSVTGVNFRLSLKFL